MRNNGKVKRADLGREKNTKASLSFLIKSARDILRKDAGSNGDPDRLLQLSWREMIQERAEQIYDLFCKQKEPEAVDQHRDRHKCQ